MYDGHLNQQGTNNTALHGAAQGKHADVVQVLIDAGTDIDEQTSRQRMMKDSRLCTWLAFQEKLTIMMKLVGSRCGCACHIQRQMGKLSRKKRGGVVPKKRKAYKMTSLSCVVTFTFVIANLIKKIIRR